MPLSQVGTALKKLMPKYRIKRYGCKTLGELYERLDRYELVKTEKGVAGMVRRKKNWKDCKDAISEKDRRKLFRLSCILTPIKPFCPFYYLPIRSNFTIIP